MSSHSNKEIVGIEQVLRSINILYDADKPDRISHFYPTSKAIVLVEHLLGLKNEKALLISAPYGSGKSLTATYMLQLIENSKKAKPVLKKIGDKISFMSKPLGKILKERIKSNKHGLVIALQGYQGNLPEAIKTAIGDSLERLGIDPYETLFKNDFSDVKSTLDSIKNIIEKKPELKIDRISFLWDEFGRHLEILLAEGRAAELNDIQMIAEFAARFNAIPFTVGLLLHQSLMNYAGKSPQSIKKEWRKIEGRFHTIQYVDNSKEIYSLIANVISNIPHELTLFNKIDTGTIIPKLRELDLFKDFSNPELHHLLRTAYPMEPITLYLLPRIASRIAQHERTLFTFLNAVDLSKPVNVEDLFDYFSHSMSMDSSFGGTYHRWLETQSAIQKADSPEEIKALKTACLLGIGMSGERTRTSTQYLLAALLGYWGDEKKVQRIIKSLIDKKLLLYRKHTNSISVWHGTDVDIAGRLEEEKNRQAFQFNLIDFLRKEIEPINWKPIKYNNDYCIQRYFRGIYIDYEELENILEKNIENTQLSPEEDGKIYYFLPRNDKEKEKGIKLIKQNGKHKQIIWAIPKSKSNLFDLALEVYCYHIIQSDAGLIESDPLVLPEIQQLSDDSTEYLQKIVDIAVNPSPKGPRFIYLGKETEIDSPKKFRQFLSQKTEKIFNSTPKLNNEMINRKNPRKTLVNARKKLLFGILDRAGIQDLGLEGYTPDVSMFRTILLNTGLYRQKQEKDRVIWYFAQPEDLKDTGLKNAWTEFKKFFTEYKENQKFEPFFEKLKQPPYGMRSGVMPILIASALRAFPSSLSIMNKKGEYLNDILPSTIEDICKNPNEYTINVHKLDEKRIKFLKNIYILFAPEENVSPREMDLLRKCYDAVELWKTTLPQAALTSEQFSGGIQQLQKILQKEKDPEQLFFFKIPSLYEITEIDQIIDNLSKAKQELENINRKYYNQAIDSLMSALQFNGADQSNIINQATTWSSYFPPKIINKISDDIIRAFVNRLKIKYDHSYKLIDSLSSLLLSSTVNRWDDAAISAFDRKVHDTVNRLEEIVLNGQDLQPDKESLNGIKNLAKSRMTFLYNKLINIAGKKEADKVIEDLKKEKTQ
ncbi:hypothetical protein GF354_03340 [Candidatus Peregrinibacteria bacterium]|nr:hypothetical protein [Candidatus Peregrinibacteria bacterium]